MISINAYAAILINISVVNGHTIDKVETPAGFYSSGSECRASIRNRQERYSQDLKTIKAKKRKNYSYKKIVCRSSKIGGTNDILKLIKF